MATRLARGRFRVNKVHHRSLVWQHGGDEAVPVSEREGDFKSLEQLEVLLKESARKSTIVTENEGHVGLLEDAVVNKGVLFWDSDNLCQHVRQPDWVYEVEVVETAKVIIVVKENAIVMEKLGSCKGGEKSRE